MAVANNLGHGDWIDRISREIMPFVEYEGYEYRYPANDIRVMPGYRIEELREASRKLFAVFCKATMICQHCEDRLLQEMEIPQDMIPFLHSMNALNLPTWLARFDFVLNESDEFKMVEINADTPCAVVESYYANELACRNFGKANPNRGCYEGLKDWLTYIYWAASPEIDLKASHFSTVRPFVFSCFEDYKEDYGTTLFLMNAMKAGVGELVPDEAICFESFYGLGIDEANQVITSDGRVAKGIYRLHPMELLIDETSDDGSTIGINMMKGYAEGKFMMFNPPESLIMQSKGFQAFLWALAEREHKSLNADEVHTIRKYMLPTYFEDDCDIGKKKYPDQLWIRKPLWGREGLDISVVDGSGRIQFQKDNLPEEIIRRESRTSIWQKYATQPMIQANTDEGFLNGYQTVSCFMLGGVPSAVYARFSPEAIAGTEAYWLPLGIE